MVELALAEDLTVSIEPGDDEWTYTVEIVHGGERVTTYGTNFDPWGRAGRHVLGNILVARIDGYDDRERVGELLATALEGRGAELEAALDAE